ncbi:MAG: polyprenyl diphosphate synthase [Candidatus Spechtbacterales bacterium]
MSSIIPARVGIILDGNRRWAEMKGLPSVEGHRRGAENVRTIAEYAFERGVKVLAFYVFSTENWKRSPAEVAFLMDLFRAYVKDWSELQEKGIKVVFAGNAKKLPKDILRITREIQAAAPKKAKGTIIVCLSYGGRDEVVRAARRAIEQNISARSLSEKKFATFLDVPELEDVDLVIRTSGEQRLSGFLLWQASYAELYFSKKMWPAFSKKDFDTALEEYASRKRRFGA